MNNSSPKVAASETFESERLEPVTNTPANSPKAKQLVPPGMQVLKCIIAEQVHHAVNVYKVTNRLKKGNAVEELLTKGLKTDPAPNMEEQLARMLRYLDRTRFDRLDKIRHERHTTWQQLFRPLLEILETQLNETTPSVPRPAFTGGTAPLTTQRTSLATVSAANASTPKVRPSGFPGVSITDNSNSDTEESGTRLVGPKR
jgi:hypothetical protein